MVAMLCGFFGRYSTMRHPSLFGWARRVLASRTVITWSCGTGLTLAAICSLRWQVATRVLDFRWSYVHHQALYESSLSMEQLRLAKMSTSWWASTRSWSHAALRLWHRSDCCTGFANCHNYIWWRWSLSAPYWSSQERSALFIGWLWPRSSRNNEDHRFSLYLRATLRDR